MALKNPQINPIHMCQYHWLRFTKANGLRLGFKSTKHDIRIINNRKRKRERERSHPKKPRSNLDQYKSHAYEYATNQFFTI